MGRSAEEEQEEDEEEQEQEEQRQQEGKAGVEARRGGRLGVLSFPPKHMNNSPAKDIGSFSHFYAL